MKQAHKRLVLSLMLSAVMLVFCGCFFTTWKTEKNVNAITVTVMADIKQNASYPIINIQISHTNEWFWLYYGSGILYFNKGNENSSINIQQSYNIIGDENSNSKLYYPEKVPKNFLPPYLFDSINLYGSNHILYVCFLYL